MANALIHLCRGCGVSSPRFKIDFLVVVVLVLLLCSKFSGSSSQPARYLALDCGSIALTREWIYIRDCDDTAVYDLFVLRADTLRGVRYFRVIDHSGIGFFAVMEDFAVLDILRHGKARIRRYQFKRM